MFAPNRSPFSRPIRARGLLALAAVLLGIISLAGAACGPANPFSALLTMAGLSQEEIEALGEQADEFSERVAALPSVAIRIVNNTEVIVEIELVSGLEQGDLGADFFGPIPAPQGGPSGFTSIDSKTVGVLPGGVATGSITCGELIGVSIRAPSTIESIDYYDPYNNNADFGLAIAPGNVRISGIGVADDAFTGDVVALGRFVRPAEDGVDCQANTLVIQIDAPAAGADDTDVSDASPTYGTASLSVE